MLWQNIKSWAKDQGYKADRKKIEGEEKSYNYTWFKIDDATINGTATSVSKVATAIYNNITDNVHVEYQQQYKDRLAQQDIKHEVEGW